MSHPSDHRPDIPPQGQLLARKYRLVRLIGQGGMGQVYHAIQVDLDRPVAIKLLRRGLGDQRGAKARFRREARVAAALRHPSALSVYDFGEDRGRFFIAMELLNGETLRDLLDRQRPLRPLSHPLEHALRVADVLVEAHRIGLIHRDLKPANIFIEHTISPVSEDQATPAPPSRVVVADFGLAFISGGEGVGRMTKTGVVTGTPAYLSPEQAMGRRIGPESDVYSLGCTLYEMIAGEVPFRGESELIVLNHHLFSTPAPLRSASPQPSAEIPVRLEQLISRMLAKHPTERPTASEVRDALAEILKRLGEPERSRGDRMLEPRHRRMLGSPRNNSGDPTIEPKVAPSPIQPPAKRLLAYQASLSEDLRLGMISRGWQPISNTEDELSSRYEAIYAPGADLETLTELRSLGAPLITDTDASDLERISALIEAGIDEVVPKPVGADSLCRRLDRMLIKRRRSRRSR